MKNIILFVLVITFICNNTYAQKSIDTSTNAKPPKIVKHFTKAKSQKLDIEDSTYRGSYSILGIGYYSPRGFGIKFQQRGGDIVGLGYSVALGIAYNIHGKAYTLFTGGIQFYPYKDLCVDARLSVQDYAYDYLISKVDYIMGPSLLIGYNLFWDKTINHSLNFASGVGFPFTGDNPPWYPLLEIGYVMRF